MAEETLNQTSMLPAMVFLLPVLAGIVIFAVRGMSRAYEQGLAIVVSAFVTGIGLWMVRQNLRGIVLTTWNNELRVDGLSVLMVVIISGVGLLASIYSTRALYEHGTQNIPSSRVRWFYVLLMWFLGAMFWACVTNNIIMLYVAVEASTLASGLLVAFYWDRRALEAGYKYLMLLTIAVTFALFGCVLLYAGAAATGKLPGGSALQISEIAKVVALIPSATAAIAVAFLVIGFGTKAGIAPFHPWLADAHAEAPTAISVLLSGVMIEMALYAMARTVGIFYPALPQVTVFLVAMGCFTMLLGIILALIQNDLKRLLAYSSVSQIGYILAGVALGSYLGCYGGLFHLLNHALAKSLLFMCAGAVIWATGARQMTDLGGLRSRMPVTSACFFVGALALAGFPPLNGFWSKLTVYLALARAGLWWAAVISVVVSILTMVVMVRAAYRVFWGEQGVVDSSGLEPRNVPARMWVPMVVLASMCVLIGVDPQLPYPLLNHAAAILATLSK